MYKPGSVHVLPRGTAKQYKMHEGCFALEYARGRSIIFSTTPPLTCYYRMDTSDVTLWFGRYLVLDPGHSHILPHSKDYSKGDYQEFNDRQNINSYPELENTRKNKNKNKLRGGR